MVIPLYAFEKPYPELPFYWREVFNFLKKNRILYKYYFVAPYNDIPKFIQVSVSSPGDRFQNVTKEEREEYGFANGSSFATEEAISKAVGELLERYPLGVYEKHKLILGSTKEVESRYASIKVLGPSQIAGFSDEQKKRNSRMRFDDNSVFHWERVKNLITGKTALIPAQLVYWRYKQDEPFIRESNTNGCGGGFSKNEAILSAIYEIVQRDAFLLYWYNHLPPPQIEKSTIPDETLQEHLAASQRYGFDIYFLNTTSDIGVFSCAAVIVDRNNHDFAPKISVGGGCSSNFLSALKRSYIEAWSCYQWIRSRGVTVKFDENSYTPFDYSSGIDQTRRLSIWANHNMFEHFRFFLEGEKESFSEAINQFGTPPGLSTDQELNHVKNRFSALGKGYEIYLYEARQAFLSKLGYHSVHVIIPEMIPLWLSEGAAVSGAKRFQSAFPKFGKKPQAPLFKFPHPFP